MPYGAFCQLEEYGNKEAFIHVSEVASRWIKNIHTFLKEGQREVGRVYRMAPDKHMIDISLKRVSDSDKKRKLDLFRRDKRAEKLFEILSEKVKKPKMKLEEVIEVITKEYEDVFGLFEDASAVGEEALNKIDITEDWKKAIVEISQSSIKQRKKEISGTLTIKSLKPNGIEIIKKALASGAAGSAKISYLGAPRYMIVVEGNDFKTCEKKLRNAVETITKEIEKAKGTCTFERKEE
jgi:translation initiation factor 2 subunit 1